MSVFCVNIHGRYFCNIVVFFESIVGDCPRVFVASRSTALLTILLRNAYTVKNCRPYYNVCDRFIAIYGFIVCVYCKLNYIYGAYTRVTVVL